MVQAGESDTEDERNPIGESHSASARASPEPRGRLRCYLVCSCFKESCKLDMPVACSGCDGPRGSVCFLSRPPDVISTVRFREAHNAVSSAINKNLPASGVGQSSGR
jgi:hypothetical protein